MRTLKLDELEPGKEAIIEDIQSDSQSLRHHIFDMGLTPGTKVSVTKTAPLGDPIELLVRGYSLTMRKDDLSKIEISNINEMSEHEAKRNSIKEIDHLRIGEKKYRPKKGSDMIPKEMKITLALVGNQNCGKTTLFNQLTGSNQHVGNFPGVTVDRKDGMILNQNAEVTDLPGIYSLSPYTSEEIVTREFILNEKPNAIINIIDASNIERNLLLTMQLIELGVPMVIALNMMDEVRANGGSIDINGLENALGIAIVPISAIKNEGIDELIEHVTNVARYKQKPARMDFCSPNGPHEGAVHKCIHAVECLIEDNAANADIPLKFATTKTIEGDSLVLEKLKIDENELKIIESIIQQMELKTGSDRLALIADMRFYFIGQLCSKFVIKPAKSKEYLRSRKIDVVLTGKYTAIPAFMLIMATIFFVTFGGPGSFLSDVMENIIGYFTGIADSALYRWQINPVVHSLVIDGIFAGVGSVLSFLPIIIILFFFMSILEDTGYMARIAFIMDKLLRKIGLSGRSFVPMLIGFGCSIPAIMATRTLPSERDRKMTIFLVPFMSCSAKLTIYALFTSRFFPNYATIFIVGLYALGIITSIIFALILKKTGFKGEPVPFVMELPNYRLPSPKNMGKLIYDRAKEFVTKAFTIIFLASIIIWFLQTFDLRFNVVSDAKDSLLGLIGGAIAPIFKPLGLADWRIVTSLMAGFVAKETVVSTLTVLLGGNVSALASMFTAVSAFTFLVFSLLYTPCVAAIAAVHRELGTKYAVIEVVLQCVIAWIVSFIVHSIIILFI